ncbi:MAG: DM13 domain-containing protein [Chitinophagaceae bacterium]|nr:DM13 domain-containing protein [Chitinophagaceae bacterium]
MKKLTVLILVSVFFLASCEKNATPSAPVVDTVSNDAMDKYIGVFMNGPYGRVSGKASVVETNGKYQLKLDSFMTTNGPDLKVYISKEVQPLNFIRLGDLKSTSGTQVYDIPGMPDFAAYKYALIHCEQYNHLFGSAQLK